METFYRLHDNPNAPTFGADNAWSATWASDFSADGTQYRCDGCDGDGESRLYRPCQSCWGEGGDCWNCGGEGELTACAACEGTGWVDCQRGYSCCDTPDELIAYMAEHGIVSDDSTIIIFQGHRTGTGFDDEPLAVPEQVLETTTWREFTARHA